MCAAAVSALAGKGPELPPLTSVEGTPRLPGKWVWADLVTDNVPVAVKFYGDLFGWTFGSIGNYVVAMNADRPMGGMFQRPKPTESDVRPRWFAYLSVRSLREAEKDVRRLGGRVLIPPKPAPKRGEQAVFADPEGAVFGVIKSSSGDPEDFEAIAGDWMWIQLLSRDARKAAEFYAPLGSYQVLENTEPNRLSDFILASEGYARATVRTIPARLTDVTPSWLLFVRVTDVQQAAERAKKLGGKVLLEPTADKLAGKVSVIADPTGAAVGLLEWSKDIVKGGN